MEIRNDTIRTICVLLIILTITLVIAYILGSLFSWTLAITNWNWFSIIISSLFVGFGIWFAYKLYEESPIARQRAIKAAQREHEKFVESNGGAITMLQDFIDTLGYPVAQHDNTSVTLTINDKATLTLTIPHWKYVVASYDVTKHGQRIQQEQNFRVSGYKPMPNAVIIKTIKEKLWNLGVAELPIDEADSYNHYNESMSFVRDLMIIAYLNTGQISDSVTEIADHIAFKSDLESSHVQGIKSAILNKGYAAFVLNRYPEMLQGRISYLAFMVTMYVDTKTDSSSSDAYDYLCLTALNLGLNEDIVKELINKGDGSQPSQH